MTSHKAVRTATHCRECGEQLAQELREIGSPVHVLCGSDVQARRISYCLWGRADGRFTPFDAKPVSIEQPGLF